MNSNNERTYYVIVAEEGREAKCEKFNTLAEAISEARSLAWGSEDGTLIIVNDGDGEQCWDNEGDWRNAIS